MPRSGHAAPHPAADASLTALVDAERHFEERLAEARRRAAADGDALELELRALAGRTERETAAAEQALAVRIAAARDEALHDLREASALREVAWRRVDGDLLQRLADDVIERVLAALGAGKGGS